MSTIHFIGKSLYMGIKSLFSKESNDKDDLPDLETYVKMLFNE